MKKRTASLLAAAVLVAVLTVSCPAPFTPARGAPTSDAHFPVDVRWNPGGAATNREIINDDTVASVGVEVLNAAGSRIGSGSLAKERSCWRGIVEVSETGLATFMARAKASNGAELYYGDVKVTLSGTGILSRYALLRSMAHGRSGTYPAQ